MNRQDCILLLNSIYPNFFEREIVRNLPEELVFEEMILPLDRFDINKYQKKLDNNISFGFYNGDLDELKKKVEKVVHYWVQLSRTQIVTIIIIVWKTGHYEKFCVKANSIRQKTACGKNIKRGNQFTRIFCPQTLSKADLKPRPNSDTLRSNATRCFSTRDTKFFADCHH